MPIVLVQGIIDQFFIVFHHAHTQHQECCHEQSVTPALLREIIVGRYSVLQYMIPETQGILSQICDLAHEDIMVLLLSGSLVQRDQAMTHGTGIYGPYLGQSQIDQFVDTIL